MASNTFGISRTVNKRSPSSEFISPSINGSMGEAYEEATGIRTPMPLIEGDPEEPSFTGKKLYDDNPYDPASGLPGTSNAVDLMNIASKTEETPKSDTAEAITKGLEESRRMELAAAGAKTSAAILRTTGAVINSNAKYQQTANNGAFAIQQAQQQALIVASQAHSKMLQEQTKGKARGQSAMISAVAQGQAAGGDLAQTAISNEDVYAAEQSMMLEINAMRQVFGLETQQRVLASDVRMAEINRDLEVSQAIVGGVADIGMAGLGVMK